MPTEPLTGSRYPASSAAPNVSQDIQNAVLDLADNTVPRFASAATRDSAYTAWVGLGNTMADGLMCTVNGGLQIRQAGVWRGVKSMFYSTTSATVWDVPVSDNSARTIATINIPDLGYAVRFRTYASLEATAGGGGRVDSRMRVATNDTWDIYIGSTSDFHKHADISPNTYTGTQTVTFEAYRILGTGSWTSTGNNFSMRVEAVPV